MLLTIESPIVTICTAQWPLYVPHSGHYMYRTVVTICTAQWSLYVPHSGHYMYRQFNIQQLYVLPTQCIYVFCVDLRTNGDYFPTAHQLTGLCMEVTRTKQYLHNILQNTRHKVLCYSDTNCRVMLTFLNNSVEHNRTAAQGWN
jgi:hypothetical protein